MRPRAERTRKPCWIRKGSTTSSRVSRSSLSVAASCRCRLARPQNARSRRAGSACRGGRNPQGPPRGDRARPSRPWRRCVPRPSPRQSRARGAAAGSRCGASRASAAPVRLPRRRRSGGRGCRPRARRSGAAPRGRRNRAAEQCRSGRAAARSEVPRVSSPRPA